MYHCVMFKMRIPHKDNPSFSALKAPVARRVRVCVCVFKWRFYFENGRRQWRLHFAGLPSASTSQRARSARRRQQDATGTPPTHGVRFTVPRRRRRRLSAPATLMGVFALLEPPSTLGYFRQPRHEANECEQQEVSCCCARLRRHA